MESMENKDYKVKSIKHYQSKKTGEVKEYIYDQEKYNKAYSEKNKK